MTSKVGFFCKSYSKDFKHLNLMLETYGDHNPENIPLVLSLPKNDINEFRMNFGIKLQNVSVVADESYCDDDLSKYNGWLGQQICKLMSGHIMDAEHYAVLDSDCYFIRDVSASELCPANGKDFVACGSLIRTVLKPSNLDLIRYINGDLALDRSHFPAPPKAPVNRLRDYIKYQNLNQDSVDVINISDIPFKIFGGSKWYYFQPGQIFSSNLLKKLIDCFASFGLRPGDAIRICPWEYNWYGEYAATHEHARTDFKISPFLHFQEASDLEFARRIGLTYEKMRRRFMFVQMASGHLPDLLF